MTNLLDGSASGKYTNGAKYALTEGQKALWLLQRLAPESAAYHVAYPVRIPLWVDVPILRRALTRLLERHPALRTTIKEELGEPFQFVQDEAEIQLDVEDASHLSDDALEERLVEEIERPFDLERGPLFRVALFLRASGGHIMLPLAHHIINDFWSMAVSAHDLGELYASEVRKAPAPLKPLRLSFADQARREAQMLNSEEGAEHSAYWRSTLAGPLPALVLPTDKPRPPALSHRGAAESMRLDCELVERLRSVVRAHKATPFMAALAVYGVLLRRYTGETDIVVGTPRAARTAETARVVGYFVNPVVIRSNSSGNPRFSDLLEQVRDRTDEAFRHGDYPFSRVVRDLRVVSEPGRMPIFQVAFAWQKTTGLVNQEISLVALNSGSGRIDSDGLPMQAVPLRSRVTQTELMFQVAEAAGELVVAAEYSTDLFTAETIRGMLRHYRRLLEAVVADPAQRIDGIAMLEESERRKLLEDFNAGPDSAAGLLREASNRCGHELFEAQAQATPQAAALSWHGGEVTYGELDAKANRIARYLRRRGVGPEVIAGVYMDRCPELVASILGILKAGGAYLAFGLNQPKERLAYVLADSRAKALLTFSWNLPELPELAAVEVICLDRIEPELASECPASPENRAGPRNLAYVIYTSGSTGKPKGALLEHRSLSHLILEQQQHYKLDSRTRVLQFAPVSFDASVWEMFMTLCHGATLCIVPQEQLMSLEGLRQALVEERVTNVTLPPSMLAALDPEGLPDLDTIISAGESCMREQVERWGRRRRFVNAYGPTEATVCAALGFCRPEDEGHPSIGKPIQNGQIYVLDSALEPVPVGVAGDLYIAGAGLARGYLGQPDLTADRFLPNPFAASPGARLYRTGDRARFLADGRLEFLGRADRQVKIRGHRIELEEVEAVLEQDPTIQDAAVLVCENDRREKFLAAYVVHRNGRLDGDGLRLRLMDQLPTYMVPSRIVEVESLPLTPSGKVDRSALPKPELTGASGEAYAPPQTELERVIAGVWKEALQVDRVGLHDNFFDLGGHSLLAAKVHSLLRERLRCELPMTDLFRYPTVVSLAARLNGERDADRTPSSLSRGQMQRQALGRQMARARSKPPHVASAPPAARLAGR